jgi:hypothetical protein
MAETPEQKYDRIAAAVHQSILNNFPNPNRVGCPGDVRLREVAERKAVTEDDDWQHITHCSPCYAEFLAAKEQIRRAGSRARTLRLIGGTLVLILLVAIPAYRHFVGARNQDSSASVTFERATLDLKSGSTARGDDKADTESIPVLPRRPLELKIILPFGSEAGPYQFELVNRDGGVLKSGSATASIANGDTALDAKLNLTSIAAGEYRLGLRKESFDWIFHRVSVR